MKIKTPNHSRLNISSVPDTCAEICSIKGSKRGQNRTRTLTVGEYIEKGNKWVIEVWWQCGKLQMMFQDRIIDENPQETSQ